MAMGPYYRVMNSSRVPQAPRMALNRPSNNPVGPSLKSDVTQYNYGIDSYSAFDFNGTGKISNIGG